ncbi:MAG: hypothetical protein H7A25_17215 [Leptospiraceae bacterium]|nr:hypothetical protein [Leptospiraceae bacterium]
MKIWIYSLFTLSLLSCGPQIRVSGSSQHFAHFDEIQSYYKAISYDDVRILIYEVETSSETQTPADLWMKEILLEQKAKGYKFLDSKNFKTDKGEEFLYSEFETFYNGKPYLYSVSVLVRDGKNIISEISGEKDKYTKQKKEALSIISSIE